MHPRKKVVAIVADDTFTLTAMKEVVSSYGYCAELYQSGSEFLEHAMGSKAQCLLFADELSDIARVELLDELDMIGLIYPAIFMSESGRKPPAEPDCVAHLGKSAHPDELLWAIKLAVGEPVAVRS